MGLDISVYQHVTLVPNVGHEDWDSYDVHVFDDNGGFPDRLDGLVVGYYRGECKLGFRAGSYSGYNAWRSSLALMVGVTDKELWQDRSEAAKATPFYELIHFSDAEGVIGPKTSAKLAKDFDEWADRAKAFASKSAADGEYWLEKYTMWSRAFHLAAETGVVQFH